MRSSSLPGLLLLLCVPFVFAAAQNINGDKGNSKIILENNKVKVTQYTSPANHDVCGKGMHSHPAHLTIILTEAIVAVKLPDGKSVQQKAPAGTCFWSEAETHEVINTGKEPVKIQLVELK